jgi:plasmid stability protein
MPTLSIKNVPEPLLDKLRARAARHHRSMQGELIALLHTALDQPDANIGHTEPRSMRRGGTRRIEEIAAEHRQRRVRPQSRGPLAADLIRSERDAR